MSAREDLGVAPEDPAKWDGLVRRIAEDEELYDKWLRFFFKNGPGPSMLAEDKWDRLCDLVTTSNLDKRKCDEILGPKPQ